MILGQRPTLVIFDCDGVLVDSEGPTAQIMSDYFTKHGYPIAPDDVHNLFVGGTLLSAGAEVEARGGHLPHDWFETLLAMVIARMKQGVEVIDGVLPLIDRLHDLGIATAIVSNGAVEKMKASLTPHGLFDAFEGRMYSAYVHGSAKPSPQMVEMAMMQAGATPQLTIMIDDSPSGCKAAVAAGVTCLGFATQGQEHALKDVGAVPVFSMAEVARAIGT